MKTAQDLFINMFTFSVGLLPFAIFRFTPNLTATLIIGAGSFFCAVVCGGYARKTRTLQP